MIPYYAIMNFMMYRLILHSSKMFVLAAIYAVMNILSFVALEYIGAGEFTICAQLKILTVTDVASLLCDYLNPFEIDGRVLGPHLGDFAVTHQMACFGVVSPRMYFGGLTQL